MARYYIFRHQRPLAGLRQYEAVKDGWCWPACLGTWGWAFAARLHRIGALMLAGWFGAIVVLYLLLTRVTPEVSVWLYIFVLILLNIVSRIIIGASANPWRRSYWSQRGYYLVETVEARSPGGAIAAYNTTDEVSNAASKNR